MATDATSQAMFPHARARAGMYESYYLRAVSPEEPVAIWIRHTVHKAPGRAPRGSPSSQTRGWTSRSDA